MNEWFATLPMTGMSIGAMVTFFYVALGRGWLVTKSAQETLVAAYKEQLAAKDQVIERERQLTTEWREAYVVAEAGRTTAAEQNGEMLEGLRTTIRVVESLPIGGDAP